MWHDKDEDGGTITGADEVRVGYDILW